VPFVTQYNASRCYTPSATVQTMPLSDLEAAQRHRYRLGGRDLVNVTAITGAFDPGDKAGAFAGAAVKLVKAGINYREEWKQKAETGDRIHGHLETWLKGQPIQQLDKDKGYVDALEKFITDYDVQPVEVEEIVLSEDGFGGRFDMIAQVRGRLMLCDLKSGKPHPVEHCLQLALYRYATGIGCYDPTSGALTGLRPLPAVDGCAALYVHEDGTYDFVEYPATRAVWEIGLGILRGLEWARSEQMKALVKGAREGNHASS
jgi:PD-(D/E)XK nuclease superfamily